MRFRSGGRGIPSLVGVACRCRLFGFPGFVISRPRGGIGAWLFGVAWVRARACLFPDVIVLFLRHRKGGVPKSLALRRNALVNP